ncbi:hypothetical protein cypCar_00016039 [Cyprinus carpio]|nr:hypothetical protein cypCar_00016039 [Cyprinus carpio]
MFAIDPGSIFGLSDPCPGHAFCSVSPLLSGKSIAAGVAGGLSASISSLAVYVVTARLLKAPVPPAHAWTFPERGLVRHKGTKKIQSLADKQQGYSHSPDTPPPVMKVLDLSGLRTVLLCACRSSPVEEVVVTVPEMSSLLPDKDAGVSSG